MLCGCHLGICNHLQRNDPIFSFCTGPNKLGRRSSFQASRSSLGLIPSRSFTFFTVCWSMSAGAGSSLPCGLSSRCSQRGLDLGAVRGLLVAAASPVAERGLQAAGSGCPRASLLWGRWDLPGPGMEAVSSALVRRFVTTKTPGKPSFMRLNQDSANFPW